MPGTTGVRSRLQRYRQRASRGVYEESINMTMRSLDFEKSGYTPERYSVRCCSLPIVRLTPESPSRRYVDSSDSSPSVRMFVYQHSQDRTRTHPAKYLIP